MLPTTLLTLFLVLEDERVLTIPISFFYYSSRFALAALDSQICRYSFRAVLDFFKSARLRCSIRLYLYVSAILFTRMPYSARFTSLVSAFVV
ncbi:hypothetical protein KP509_39G028000 [Ceratopteris richardii]|uniref:Secreted protein n=1 Tax=Ceratopteris richardii TaxID=49495 RepID=A0A8T2PZN8_CERRI|nr:hypothetical protein KP509_39G028000 [Ceratopteris richardii]